MAHYNPEEPSDVNGDLSHEQLDFHQLMLSRSKLKSTVRTSTILAGFAMVAMVEVELEGNPPNGLLIPFAIFTSILIFVHLFALMLATYMLPELDALASVPPNKELARRPSNIAQGICVKMTWILSHVLGIILFLVQFVLLAIVKFYPINNETEDGHKDEDRHEAAIAAGVVIVTLTIGAVLATLVWYCHWYVRSNIKGQMDALRAADSILQEVNANDPLHPIAGSHKNTVI